MAATQIQMQAPNPRASLLSGLRTGGVRSASGPMMVSNSNSSSSVNSFPHPHTAAPYGSFNFPRYPSHVPHYPSFPEDDEDYDDGDDGIIGEITSSQNFYVNPGVGVGVSRPLTAAVDGPNNRFSHHQQQQQQQQHQQSRMNANSPPFVPAFAVQTPQAQAQAQALQEMQLLQMEVMRLQTVQAQQYKAGVQANYLAELARQQLSAQSQSQTQTQAPIRRASFNPPSTAGPLNGSFDLRSATLSAQTRRANQAELLKAQLGLGLVSAASPAVADEQVPVSVPMSAALGGKFGSRSISNASPPHKFAMDFGIGIGGNGGGEQTLQGYMPTTTTVISGGTPLGTPISGSFNSSANSSTTNVSNTNANNNANNASTATTPSKSDSAVSWRRGGNNNSVLSGNNRASPTVRITPPPPENSTPSPPPGLTLTSTTGKARPLPLRFSAAASQPMPVVAIDTSIDGSETIEVELPLRSSSGSSSSKSSSLSPTTTTSPSSAYGDIPLSPREEAAKKLYEGLGIGRPAPVVVNVPAAPPVVSLRMTSQPMRQPRGPPSGADELGPKNFATRIRRKAIGGLGVLMGARERREAVEAY